jgi:hypothetical protein
VKNDAINIFTRLCTPKFMRDYAFLHSLYDSIHFSGHRQVNLFAQRITAESPPIENSRNRRTSFLARLSRVEQNQEKSAGLY